MSRLEEVISKYANKQEDSEELERLKRQEKKGKGVRQRLPPPALSSWGFRHDGWRVRAFHTFDLQPFIFRISNLRRKEKKR